MYVSEYTSSEERESTTVAVLLYTRLLFCFLFMRFNDEGYVMLPLARNAPQKNDKKSTDSPRGLSASFVSAQTRPRTARETRKIARIFSPPSSLPRCADFLTTENGVNAVGWRRDTTGRGNLLLLVLCRARQKMSQEKEKRGGPADGDCNEHPHLYSLKRQQHPTA